MMRAAGICRSASRDGTRGLVYCAHAAVFNGAYCVLSFWLP